MMFTFALNFGLIQF